ncbi:hypothetical protein CASFOL_031835 [Castilleja foliolosa]|uniref:Reverse transcriptase domain-containing protein n=1 Tax=Castilleja foliolosa TaxID=1961234 RepID=A0ABD3C148_9LAMI
MARKFSDLARKIFLANLLFFCSVNSVVESSEKLGGNAPNLSGMLDFLTCIVNNGLAETPVEGNIYTWWNNQKGKHKIWERIDRFLLNNKAYMEIQAPITIHLPRKFSDHKPIVLKMEEIQKIKSRFVFKKMWLDHTDFKDNIKNIWREIVTGSPGYIMAEKLRRVRKFLKVWNWECFGNIQEERKQKTLQVEDLENKLQKNWSEKEEKELDSARKRLEDLHRWHYDLLRLKSRTQWIKEGDRNSKFYNAAIKERRLKNKLRILQEVGTEITDTATIGQLAVDHYSTLFQSTQYCIKEELFQGISKRIQEIDNEELIKIPEEAEIFQAVKELSPESAPGMDGFTGHFYRECREIINIDVQNLVTGFFRGDQMSRANATTSLILLPKVERPKGMGDYRPISLLNFSGKIISRIIATRLGGVLHKIIDNNQAGFIKNRSIHETVALAQELTQDLDKKTFGGNLILKLDMAKAYDKMEWRFIIRAMRAYGFHEQFIDLIFRNLSNIQYTIFVNGEYYGLFKSLRGVRQGDPLSPLIFILGQQILSHNLKHLTAIGCLEPYRLSRKTTGVSHLMFADDMILFCNGGQKNMKRIKELLQMYEVSSGQQINYHKSEMYLSRHICEDRKKALQALMHCKTAELPFQYLGAPIYKGRGKSSYFEAVIQKIIRKMEGWKSNFLTFSGKALLLKTVLGSIPVTRAHNLVNPRLQICF